MTSFVLALPTFSFAFALFALALAKLFPGHVGSDLVLGNVGDFMRE